MVKSENFFKLKEPFHKVGSSEEFFDLCEKDTVEDIAFWPNDLNHKNRFSKYPIRNTTFRNCSFKDTEIKNIVFTDCKFYDCLFLSTFFNSCDFHSCEFQNSNLSKARFVDTYIDPRFFNGNYDKKSHQNLGVGLYHDLLQNSRNTHQPNFTEEAQILFNRWDRYQNYRDAKLQLAKNDWRGCGNLAKVFFDTIWDFAGYGIRLIKLVRFVAIVIAIFCFLNFLFADFFGISNTDQGLLTRLIDSLYFTVISVTTVGYGDISPTTNAGRVWASIQGLIGVVMFAFAAAAAYRKVRA